MEKEKALCLQQGYSTKCCPICLESFDYGDDEEKATNDNNDNEINKKHSRNESLDITLNDDDPSHSIDHHSLMDESVRTTTSTTISTMMLLSTGRPSFVSVDKHGVPLRGADGKKIKILRCGHIFCDTCWKNWVHSGCGNPCNCPVCRQDVGRTNKSKTTSNSSTNRRQHQRGDSHSTAGNGSHMNVTGNRSSQTNVPDEVSTSLLSQSDPSSNPTSASLPEGYGSLSHHHHTRDESLDGLLSTTDSFSVEQSLLVDSNHNNSTMSSSPIRTNRNGITLDVPIVGGGASFLIYHHLAGNNTTSGSPNNNRNNNNHNDINSGTLGQPDGERTPLLFSSIRNHID
jgi:Prokaryotic RING finger family 4